MNKLLWYDITSRKNTKSLLTQLFYKKNMSQVTSNCYEEAAAIDLITIMILLNLLNPITDCNLVRLTQTQHYMYTVYYLQIFQHTLFVFFQKTELAQVFVTFISDLTLFLLFYA